MTTAVIDAPHPAAVSRVRRQGAAADVRHVTIDPSGPSDDVAVQRAGEGHRALIAAERALHRCGTVSELFACATDCALDLGFARAIIASVVGRGLSAEPMGVPSDAGSDLLRRRLLAHPVTLRPGCQEALVIERAEGARAGASAGNGASVLARLLDLDTFTFAAIMPEHQVLALLVLDRPGPALCPAEHEVVHIFARFVGCALERLVLRERIHDFAAELKFLTSSAQAFVREVVDAPLRCMSDRDPLPAYGWGFPAPSGSDEVLRALTAREHDIAEQLVAGRSNREIATVLQISPETVKAYVARVRHKLDAANRADAAVRYLRLSRPQQ